jgi:hypothetical protein
MAEPDPPSNPNLGPELEHLLADIQSDRKRMKERTDPLIAKANQQIKELEATGKDLHKIDREFNQKMDHLLIEETVSLAKGELWFLWENVKDAITAPFDRFGNWNMRRRIAKHLRQAEQEVQESRERKRRETGA